MEQNEGIKRLNSDRRKHYLQAVQAAGQLWSGAGRVEWKVELEYVCMAFWLAEGSKES